MDIHCGFGRMRQLGDKHNDARALNTDTFSGTMGHSDALIDYVTLAVINSYNPRTSIVPYLSTQTLPLESSRPMDTCMRITQEMVNGPFLNLRGLDQEDLINRCTQLFPTNAKNKHYSLLFLSLWIGHRGIGRFSNATAVAAMWQLLATLRPSAGGCFMESLFPN